MNELEFIGTLCHMVIEQDRQISEQEAAIKNLSDEIEDIMEILANRAEKPGD